MYRTAPSCCQRYHTKTYDTKLGKRIANEAAKLERAALARRRLTSALDEILVTLLRKNKVKEVGLELAKKRTREPHQNNVRLAENEGNGRDEC